MMTIAIAIAIAIAMNYQHLKWKDVVVLVS
jgi:hypothetical protein